MIGVVSWSTRPNATAACGGLTGVTPLLRERAWIVETARNLYRLELHWTVHVPKGSISF